MFDTTRLPMLTFFEYPGCDKGCVFSTGLHLLIWKITNFSALRSKISCYWRENTCRFKYQFTQGSLTLKMYFSILIWRAGLFVIDLCGKRKIFKTFVLLLFTFLWESNHVQHSTVFSGLVSNYQTATILFLPIRIRMFVFCKQLRFFLSFASESTPLIFLSFAYKVHGMNQGE